MTAIVDYGVGNLFSLSASLRKIGTECIISRSAEEISSCDRIILPGVGAFGDAIKKLSESGLIPTLREAVRNNKPLLGICLGMQLLFTESFEYGHHKGLGFINGVIRPLSEDIDKSLKVPHMGWNRLDLSAESPILKYTKDGDYVYFVHSYYACQCADALVATSNYDVHVPAIVQNGNIFGCQFHPEKSGNVGLGILKAFCEL